MWSSCTIRRWERCIRKKRWHKWHNRESNIHIIPIPPWYSHDRKEKRFFNRYYNTMQLYSQWHLASTLSYSIPYSHMGDMRMCAEHVYVHVCVWLNGPWLVVCVIDARVCVQDTSAVGTLPSGTTNSRTLTYVCIVRTCDV